MKPLLLMTLLSLTGCGSSTEPRHIAFAEAQCAPNGGLRSFEVHWLHSSVIEVRCQNHAVFKVQMKD